MIITQTPLRISFAGGLTDFADFYGREDGLVVSAAIDKYIFVIINERFDDRIYVNYSKREAVDHPDEIEHDLIREALRLTGVTRGVEITTLTDIPSEGSGLGSSSSITVGLLNALYTYCGNPQPTEKLARDACEIEIERCGQPIGKQDQYIAAYGGLCGFTFRPGGVEVDRLGLADGHAERLSDSLMLFYTNKTRKAETILREQKANMSGKFDLVKEIKSVAQSAAGGPRGGGDRPHGRTAGPGLVLEIQDVRTREQRRDRHHVPEGQGRRRHGGQGVRRGRRRLPAPVLPGVIPAPGARRAVRLPGTALQPGTGRHQGDLQHAKAGIEMIREYLEWTREVLGRIEPGEVQALVDLLMDARKDGRGIFVIGNGGSAATASHFAVDLGKGTLRGTEDQPRFRVNSLTDNLPYVTAWANDFDYDLVFEQQLRNLGAQGDVVIGISASGNSPNVVRALEFARSAGMVTVALTGFSGGALKEMADHSVPRPRGRLRHGGEHAHDHRPYHHHADDFPRRGRRMTLRSFAKINLAIHLLGKRTDGYHEILTLMETVDLADDLVVSGQEQGTTVTCSHPAVPTDGRNLAHRAADLVRERCGLGDRGVRIHIEKRIPVAAGLAGGSGNAAMTLHGLNALWSLGLGEEDLTDLAAELGSDVPFCLHGGVAVASGRGEKVAWLDAAGPRHYVLVCPPLEVASGWAYSQWKMELTKDASSINLISSVMQAGDAGRLASCLHNDLEPAVRAAHPRNQQGEGPACGRRTGWRTDVRQRPVGLRTGARPGGGGTGST